MNRSITVPSSANWKLLEEVCNHLRRNRGRLEAAMHEDGWPHRMVRQGITWHLETWDAVTIWGALQREWSTLRRPTLRTHGTTLHIWPTLPGAGVTPLLYGIAVGASRQLIRGSSRGRALAKAFAQICSEVAGDTIATTDISITTEALQAESIDTLLVSGTDATIETIRSSVALPEDSRCPLMVTGYGSRESMAVVDLEALGNSPNQRLLEVLSSVAQDLVMWHQYGCFSIRRIVIITNGLEDSEIDAIGGALAAALSVYEERWGATSPNTALFGDGILSQQAQERELARSLGRVWEGRFGWVSYGNKSALVRNPDGSVTSKKASLHTVELELVTSLEDIAWAPKNQMQGVMIGAEGARYHEIAGAAREAGATRVSGRWEAMQCPPGDWPHDGAPNISPWLPSLPSR